MYKRQNKGRTDKKRIRVQGVNSLRQDGGEEFLRNYAWYELSALKFLLENHFHRITPVSYTHLDVYKRQISVMEVPWVGRTILSAL